MTRPTFEMTLTALPEHIDELGHVNNAVWVQWVQLVAVAHWESVADAGHKGAYFWVVVRHEIDYLRPMKGIASVLGPGSARRRRERASTASSSLPVPTGKSAFAREPSGRLSTKRWDGRSACRAKS